MLLEVLAKIEAQVGGTAYYEIAELSDPTQCEDAIKNIIKKYGKS